MPLASLKLILSLFISTLLLSSCGGNSADASANAQDQVDALTKQGLAEVNRIAQGSIPPTDSLIPPKNTKPDPANELVICPVPVLPGKPFVFNRYTPGVSEAVTDFKEDIRFKFSKDFYLYFFAPIDPNLITSQVAPPNEIISLGEKGQYGTATLLNYSQGALPSKIVVNNVAYDPKFFFTTTGATATAQTTPESLLDVFLVSNGVNPSVGTLEDVNKAEAICEVDAASYAAGKELINTISGGPGIPLNFGGWIARNGNNGGYFVTGFSTNNAQLNGNGIILSLGGNMGAEIVQNGTVQFGSYDFTMNFGGYTPNTVKTFFAYGDKTSHRAFELDMELGLNSDKMTFGAWFNDVKYGERDADLSNTGYSSFYGRDVDFRMQLSNGNYSVFTKNTEGLYTQIYSYNDPRITQQLADATGLKFMSNIWGRPGYNGQPTNMTIKGSLQAP